MSRYIDADAFYAKLHRSLPYDSFDVLEELRQFPTADVVEVKHGEWQVYYDEDSPQDGIWKCSICGYIRFIDDISPTNYCPNCGAKMDERKEEQ